jgi:hypothetical protein
MAIFDVGQSVVNSAASYISGTTAIDVTEMLENVSTAMETMEIPELAMLAVETALVSLCMKILSVFIMVALYNRMIEIYLYSSVAPIPVATMSNREWGQIGNNYLRGLLALGFQGFFIMVCVAIYTILVSTMDVTNHIHMAIFEVAAYTVLLCLSVLKTSSIAKSVFNAH